jgi:hypothetical protein
MRGQADEQRFPAVFPAHELADVELAAPDAHLGGAGVADMRASGRAPSAEHGALLDQALEKTFPESDPPAPFLPFNS